MKGFPTVEELSARHAAACDLKQKVDRDKIAAAMIEWCVQIGAPAETKISFVASFKEIERVAWDAWAAWVARVARAAWVARVARDARVARVARDARVARVARDAWVARVARDAWDARDAWAVRVAWDAWDASYISINAIGAVSLDDEKQARIWLPILEAFEAGAFAFFVTDAEIFVSTIPAAVKTDDQRRLHCETGPAFVWLEDVRDFYWHGTNVPAEWMTDRASLTAKMALKWENVEQRRAACEIVGWFNILRQLKAKTIDRDEDPMIGELVEVTIPDIGKERFLKVRCGTGRDFALPMPPHVKTALEGNAWSYGVDTQVLKSLEART